MLKWSYLLSLWVLSSSVLSAGISIELDTAVTIDTLTYTNNPVNPVVIDSSEPLEDTGFSMFNAPNSVDSHDDLPMSVAHSLEFYGYQKAHVSWSDDISIFVHNFNVDGEFKETIYTVEEAPVVNDMHLPANFSGNIFKQGPLFIAWDSNGNTLWRYKHLVGWQDLKSVYDFPDGVIENFIIFKDASIIISITDSEQAGIWELGEGMTQLSSLPYSKSDAVLKSGSNIFQLSAIEKTVEQIVDDAIGDEILDVSSLDLDASEDVEILPDQYLVKQLGADIDPITIRLINREKITNISALKTKTGTIFQFVGDEYFKLMWLEDGEDEIGLMLTPLSGQGFESCFNSDLDTYCIFKTRFNIYEVYQWINNRFEEDMQVNKMNLYDGKVTMESPVITGFFAYGQQRFLSFSDSAKEYLFNFTKQGVFPLIEYEKEFEAAFSTLQLSNSEPFLYYSIKDGYRFGLLQFELDTETEVVSWVPRSADDESEDLDYIQIVLIDGTLTKAGSNKTANEEPYVAPPRAELSSGLAHYFLLMLIFLVCPRKIKL